jgi:23S rRNA (uracil1939-C5)-methyltransferase
VPYPQQLEAKQRELARLLRASLGPRMPEVAPVIGQAAGLDGMPWGFRHKAAFVFGSAGNTRRLVMGHYAAGSQRVVPVDACPVHSPRANRLAFALRDHLARAGVPAAGPRLEGILRHVLIRTTADDREAVVMVVVTRNDRSLRAPLRAFLASADPPPTGLLVNIHVRPGPFMVGERTLRIAGRAAVRETRPGATFLVSPTAFFQTNPDAAAVLVDQVLGEAGDPRPGRTVADLYAGSGLFAVPLALRGDTVLAVEENARAVRDGEVNARVNGVPPGRLRFLRARVESAIAGLQRVSPSVVLLDPPRQGCGARVMRMVFRDLAPARAVYVSCDPGSLARELPAARDAGYVITRVQPLDMFPHTPHIETVVTLERE